MKPPTLEAGISIPRRQPPERFSRQRGFTLFEILVVVIIVIITVSAVVFSTSLSRGDNDLKLLGNDMGKLLHLIYQEAVFENRNYAISINDKGYSLLEYNGESWAVSDQAFYRKIKLSEAHRSTLIVNNLEVALGESENPVPHILILASGEMSSFEWHIADTRLNSEIILQGDFLGNIIVLGPATLSDV